MAFLEESSILTDIKIFQKVGQKNPLHSPVVVDLDIVYTQLFVLLCNAQINVALSFAAYVSFTAHSLPRIEEFFERTLFTANCSE